MIVLLNEIFSNVPVGRAKLKKVNGFLGYHIGYTYFDLDKYRINTCKVNEINKFVVWGEKENDKLFAFKHLPVEYRKDNVNIKGKIFSTTLIIIGKIKFFNDFLYLVSNGSSILRLLNQKDFLDLRLKEKFKNVNVDNRDDKIQSNKGTLPIIDLLKLRDNRIKGDYKVVADSQEDVAMLMSALRQIYRKEETDYIERKEIEKKQKPKLSLRQKTEEQKEINKIFNANSVIMKSYLNSDYLILETFRELGFKGIENKKRMSEVQYNIDIKLDRLEERVKEFMPIYCNDKRCSDISSAFKRDLYKLKNYNKEREYINQGDSVLTNLVVTKRFEYPPCINCIPIKNLYASFTFCNEKEMGGFVSVKTPEMTYLKIEGIPNYNLGFLYSSYHEFVHYITMNGYKIGFHNNDDTVENQNLQRIINEGLTDMLAGYFTYLTCKENYKNKIFLRDMKGKIISLEGIKKVVSPYLDEISKLNKGLTKEKLEEIYSKKDIFTSNIYNKSREKRSYYLNSLVVYKIAELVGITNLISAFYANDFDKFKELCFYNIGVDFYDELFEKLKGNKSGILVKNQYEDILELLEG